MISPSTIKVFPAQVAYPATKKQLLPDFRDVFPSGFGSKEPFAYPEGTSVINPTASLAQAFAAQQRGPSGGGVVAPGGKVIDTTKGPPGGGGGGGFSDILGGISIGGNKIGSIVFVGAFLVIIIGLIALTRKSPAAPKRRSRKRGPKKGGGGKSWFGL